MSDKAQQETRHVLVSAARLLEDADIGLDLGVVADLCEIDPGLVVAGPGLAAVSARRERDRRDSLSRVLDQVRSALLLESSRAS